MVAACTSGLAIGLYQAFFKDETLETVRYLTSLNNLSFEVKRLQPEVIVLETQSRQDMQDSIRIIKRESKSIIIALCLNQEGCSESIRAGAHDSYIWARPEHALPESLKLVKELIFKINLNYDRNKVQPAAMQKAKTAMGRLSTGFKGIIAIGASAGGTEAIAQVIERLPTGMPPIIIVQHMPPTFTKIYADRLNRDSVLNVAEAKDFTPVVPGSVLVAPGGKQMRLSTLSGQYVVRCQIGERVSGHCPSVDVMFQSVAEVMGRNAVGVILTGMGSDGARGLLEMRQKGAYTIGQDEKSSMVYGMPMVAFKCGAVQIQASLEDIPGMLVKYLNRM